jgi:DNA-binding MarR family transcriptional regulator
MHETWESLGLHRGQPLVLRMLWEQDGRIHSELAAVLRRSPATITNMVKRMEKAGFVERCSDPDDERVSRVYLTDAGREIQAGVEAAWRSFEQQTFSGFEQDELDTLCDLLMRVLDNLIPKES